jgi:dihydroorotate dehydrogenase electron transfer subunit
MPQDTVTPVLRNLDLGQGNFLLEFQDLEAARTTDPGQFFMIGMNASEILLRRPFSVCGLPGTFEDGTSGALQILYRVFGRGTALLASLKPGALISVLGPLGKGFAVPPIPDARPVFVAGGIGVAPFPALTKMVAPSNPRPLLLYGARSASDLPLLHWFRDHAEVVVTTDDGSLGRKALVTAPLEELLAKEDPKTLHLYACGPSPMLHAVARIATRAGVTCDLSMEAPMACGFGVCLGCVVPCHAPDGGVRYERVCVEGPVMDARRLAL